MARGGPLEWATPAVTDIATPETLAWAFLADRAAQLRPQRYDVAVYLADLRRSPQVEGERVATLARGGDADADRALKRFIFAAAKKGRALPAPVRHYAKELLIDGRVPRFRRARKKGALLSRDFAIADAVQYMHDTHGLAVGWGAATPSPPASCACSVVCEALKRFDICLSPRRVFKIHQLAQLKIV